MNPYRSVVAAMVLLPWTLHAQPATPAPARKPLGCGAMVCAEAAAITAALGAVWPSVECRAGSARVLRALYVTPFTDYEAGHPPQRAASGVPFAPGIARLDRTQVEFIRSLSRNVTVVDTLEVISDTSRHDDCLYVFGVPKWIGVDMVRIEVLAQGQGFFVQHFVVVKNDGARWRVIAVERGAQS